MNCTIIYWLETTTSLKFSDTCSSLPPDISSLTTDETFPVNYNTAVTVRCTGDKVLAGNSVITCIKGRKFRFQEEPTCDTIGKFH